MRRSIKSLLLTLVALAYASAAGAVVIQVGPGGEIPVLPSDEIAMDIWLDSEGVSLAGYQFHAAYDPALLDVVSAVQTPPPGFSSYLSNPESPGVLIADGVNWTGSAVVNQSVLQVVFHVMDAPPSTIIDVAPILIDYGVLDSLLDGSYVTVPPGDISLVGTTLHVMVPEPSTALLLGLGLLGIHYAGRRR